MKENFTTIPIILLYNIKFSIRIRENKWYEVENSSIIHFKNAKYDPRDLKDLADDYIQCHPIENHHIEWGLI